ncbi:ABC transporter ATP-binding protein [Nocardioides sp. CN2-186]|uniref:ABC transporter ATP-binding protein n=1 Tax=Nocardioides tweenelious TaxID=3156607 RepID=UPI0032B4A885
MSALLEVTGLAVEIGQGRDARRVVDGVDLRVDAGECLGVVGESGSGKSLTMRAVIGLLPRSARVAAGDLRFVGADGELAAYDAADLRGHGIAMVFQEPMTALNPTRRVGDQIADGVIAGRRERSSRKQAREIAIGLMTEVGIPDPATRARAYPHELSGGLRQRVMIAMALSGNPRLLICDEPTTALDVTVQDQILGLLDRLRVDRRLGLLFVTHDLGVIAQVSQRIAVMYDGRIVEHGRTAEVLADPQHPYTASLRAAAAAIEGDRSDAPSSPAEVP